MKYRVTFEHVNAPKEANPADPTKMIVPSAHQDPAYQFATRFEQTLEASSEEYVRKIALDYLPTEIAKFYRVAAVEEAQ